ncbi:MAG: HNH endonuclease [Lachnospiraceae bacterium]|nr:HNH endonuclease [Lachnospiraceae bacterium]
MKLMSLFDGNYTIYDDGRLYSERRKRFIKPNHDKHGYLYYVISINGKRSTHKAHRLVAKAFIPNPDKKDTVNHKNGIRDDNRVQNLEWATPKEQQHDPLTRKKFLDRVIKTDYLKMSKLATEKKKKTTYVYDMNGNLLYTFASLVQCCKELNINPSHASQCANGQRNSTSGYVVKYE